MKASAKEYKSESDVQGAQRPLPGTYHVIVKDANDKRQKKDGSPLTATIVEVSVLAGTVPGQEGREATIFLRLDQHGNESEQHVRFCLAAGLLKPGEEREFEFESEAVGKQLVVGLEEYVDKNQKKQLSVANYGLAFWHVTNPEVASIPKDQRALQLLAGGNATGNGTAAASQQPPSPTNGSGSHGGNGSRQTTQPAPAATAANDYSDL